MKLINDKDNCAKSHMFFAQKPNFSRRFLEIDPENLHTCSVSPCRPVNEGRFIFLAGNWGLLKAQISTEKNK